MSEPPFGYDLDLVRDVLIWAEHGGSQAKRPDAPMLSLAYHVKIMQEAGLIDGLGKLHRDAATGEWDGDLAMVRMPTLKGQDFLKAVRSDTVWNHAKGQLKEHGLPLMLDLLKTTALAYAVKAGVIPSAGG